MIKYVSINFMIHTAAWLALENQPMTKMDWHLTKYINIYIYANWCPLISLPIGVPWLVCQLVSPDQWDNPTYWEHTKHDHHLIEGGASFLFATGGL